MVRLLIAGAALSAVIVSGLVHGVWTGRWELTDEPAASAARLQSVARELDDWQGHVDEADVKQLGGISGYLSRRYTNRSNGSVVTVFLVCGRPGPVSIHPPDVCYRASGYQVSAPTKYTAPADDSAPPAEFRTALMVKARSADRTHLRVFWSWNATGTWMVPDDPRMTFAPYPALFKLYLIREMSNPDEPVPDDACIDLMRQLLPELQRRLFAQS